MNSIRLTRRQLLTASAASIAAAALAGCATQANTGDCWLGPNSGDCTESTVTIDRPALDALMARLAQQQLGVRGLVVVQNSTLVYERYAPGLTAADRPHLYSCTKSIVSLLVGIALDQQLLPTVDARLVDCLPQHAAKLANPDPRKQQITLRHLLTMSSGFDWPEFTPWTAKHPLVQMQRSAGWVQYVLDRPMAADPGTRWNYNTGAVHLFAAILQRTAKQRLQDFAVANLFGPLGITNFAWEQDPQGINVGGYGLELTARDLAKLGLLCLHNGRWQDRQLVPAAWLAESVQRRFAAEPADRGYGYLWWLPPFGGYAATGYGGHRLFILPDRNLVVALTATMSEAEMTDTPEALMQTAILPALAQPPT